jgi:hypothetical protein
MVTFRVKRRENPHKPFKAVINARKINHQNSVPKTFEKYIPAIGVMIGILVTLGYFFGWRYMFSYYSGFGIDPIYFKFPPTDIFYNGWRIYLFIFCSAIISIYLFIVVKDRANDLIQKEKYNLLAIVFILFSSFGILSAGLLFAGWLTLWGFHAGIYFYILGYSAYGFLLTALSLGSVISSKPVIYSLRKPKFFTLFKLIYPNPQLWLVFLFVFYFFMTTYFSGWNGTRNYLRDSGEYSRLQILNLYTNHPVNISGGTKVRDRLWMYSDLRLVYMTDHYYFVFKPEEVQRSIVKLHVIPNDTIEEIELKSWYDKFAH